MKYEAPGRQESEPQELPPHLRSSGSLGSSLNKAMQKDTRIPEDKKWVRDLIREIPANQLGIVTDFLENVPPDKAEGAAHQLFEVIHNMTQGILRSDDPKEALKNCIEEVKKRLEN
ncbi:MAG TPA: hypothetical protein VHZ04_01530 [Candidatus Paceibacterota bacterium]|jgi:hypothetical protein|nr:hypothetical protein [Candidatus Paceibacterota bacterium]